MKKVFLIGSGGREHAIYYKLKQSPQLGAILVYPGNGGIPREDIVTEKINLKNKTELQEFVKKSKFDLVVVGPEDPLVDGVADWMHEIGIPCFGPSAYCAQIEGSKDFAKNLMVGAGVPTAAFATFTDFASAEEYIKSSPIPVVIKADGLAAGKGVTVCFARDDAYRALKEIFHDRLFGDMRKVVIEEFMDGEEASVFALCDGENFALLPAAQDHKRAFDGDKGPNTGGMGAYCPAPVVTDGIIQQVKAEIIRPVMNYFKAKGFPYKGVLYAGLMIKNGKARVVEFNCRFGDPETQAVLLLLQDDLLQIMHECATGNLQKSEFSIYPGAAAIVVLAAEGYPGSYNKNIPLEISDTKDPNIQIFHAGTALQGNKLVSSGGRILGITARGADLKETVGKIYSYMGKQSNPGTFYRKDIAWRAL